MNNLETATSKTPSFSMGEQVRLNDAQIYLVAKITNVNGDYMYSLVYPDGRVRGNFNEMNLRKT